MISSSNTEISSLGEDISFLSADEAAEFLHIKLSTLYKWSSERRLPSYKIGKQLMFKRSELREFIEAHRVTPQSELIEQAATNLLTRKGR